MPELRLGLVDAAELAELLQFLAGWLARDPGRLGASLEEFVGHPAYNVSQLRQDLAFDTHKEENHRYRRRTLESVKHHLRPNRQRSVGPRHDRYGEGQALNNLGNAHRDLRRFEDAVTCYQDALVIYRETGDRHGEGQALSNLDLAYQGLRQPIHAQGWRDAAAAMRDAGDTEAAAALKQAANAQSRRRRWRRGS
jgi:tetratricopeptide (TPR) repeat protein